MNMSNIEKQIFCTDPKICAAIATLNSQNKWELWGLNAALESGEAIYEIRLFEDDEFDAVEPINTTSGHTHIKVLKDNNWSEIILIENKKAAGERINPTWRTVFSNPPLLKLSFDHEDEHESIESLVQRGAGKNQTVLIDQINAADLHFSEGVTERLLAVIDYFLQKGIDVNARDEWGETALMAAANYGNADILSLLLQNGANVNDKDNYGNTALLYITGYEDDYNDSKLFSEKQIKLLKLML
ncbi:MAG: ankyrin repeat domain-containing protein, partial [Bacteroidales bacterium]|nr:ankyrin repeat domain-containing protein [Bacteroidales bacterium]